MMLVATRCVRLCLLLCLGAAATLASGAARVHALDAGQKAPEIGLVDMNGKEVSLSKLRGQVVLVDFWASWCGPCRESLPVLEKLAGSYRGKGLVVVGVNIDKTPEAARAFLQKHKLTLSFPVVNDSKHQVAGRYEPPTMPSSYLIDREGRVHRVHKGFRSGDAAKLKSEIEALLK